jgi:hypothetical protein
MTQHTVRASAYRIGLMIVYATAALVLACALAALPTL